MVAAALVIILVAKPLAALSIVALLGHSGRTALTVAVGLAQIGEFSFILSELARRYELMPDAGHNVLVASAIISITLNPLLFRALPKAEAWMKERPFLWGLLNRRAERWAAAADAVSGDRLQRKVVAAARLAIVVGYGPVGRSVHRLLQEAGLSTVVIDLSMDAVASLRADGHTAIFGDASRASLLEQAGVRNASHLILTFPHSSDRAAVVTAARSLSPTVRILVRARYLREREDLKQAGATAAVFEEAEAAVALARLVLADTGLHREAAVALSQQAERGLSLSILELAENLGEIGGTLLLQQVQQVGGRTDTQQSLDRVEDEIDSALRRHEADRFTTRNSSI